MRGCEVWFSFLRAASDSDSRCDRRHFVYTPFFLHSALVSTMFGSKYKYIHPRTSDAILEGKSLSDESALVLASELKGHTKLKKLRLGQNVIGDVGTTAIMDSLKGNTSLKELHFHDNNIGVAGAMEVARFLKQDTTLTVLYLWKNDFGDEGAAAIAEALKVNSSLSRLYLDSNTIGNVGMSRLAEALKENKSLRLLSLGYNVFDDSGATSMLEALKNSHSPLKTLDLSNSRNISAAQASAINKSMRSILKANRSAPVSANQSESPVVTLQSKGLFGWKK
jgi:Ran GTPase-activating protein (RanGAP) involved in mRNA processing and transport